MKKFLNFNYLKNKSIFLTGGTGSFGKEFTNYVLKNCKLKKLVIFSRDELKQYEMMEKFHPSKFPVDYVIGDIRDKQRVINSSKGIDFLIHAAALKQVPTAELNPFEFIKTNIIGSDNIIEASKVNKIKKVIALSTDKASSPINLYGATKLTSDKLFISSNHSDMEESYTKFSIVRYGNVLGSRGSVLPLFLKQKKEEFFTITDPRMTRFFITLSQGVNFVLNSLYQMKGAEIFVPKIPSIKITDLAAAIDSEKNIKYIGVRPGEKLHEQMISKDDAFYTLEKSLYYTILPSLPWWKRGFSNKSKFKSNVPDNFSYTSETNDNFLSRKDIVNLIKPFLD